MRKKKRAVAAAVASPLPVTEGFILGRAGPPFDDNFLPACTVFFFVVLLFDPFTLATRCVCVRASCFFPRGLGSLALVMTSIWSSAQEFVKEKLGEGAGERPCTFVFHGGSGSSEEDIQIAVKVQQLLAPAVVALGL